MQNFATLPPLTRGGPIEARVSARAIAAGMDLPPLTRGGTIEADLERFEFVGELDLPPLTRGGTIEAPGYTKSIPENFLLSASNHRRPF